MAPLRPRCAAAALAARLAGVALAGREGGGERRESGGLAPQLCCARGKGRGLGEAARASCWRC